MRRHRCHSYILPAKPMRGHSPNTVSQSIMDIENVCNGLFQGCLLSPSYTPAPLTEKRQANRKLTTVPKSPRLSVCICARSNERYSAVQYCEGISSSVASRTMTLGTWKTARLLLLPCFLLKYCERMDISQVVSIVPQGNCRRLLCQTRGVQPWVQNNFHIPLLGKITTLFRHGRIQCEDGIILVSLLRPLAEHTTTRHATSSLTPILISVSSDPHRLNAKGICRTTP